MNFKKIYNYNVLNKKILGHLYKYTVLTANDKSLFNFNNLLVNKKYNILSNNSINFINVKFLNTLISQNFNITKNYKYSNLAYNIDINLSYIKYIFNKFNKKNNSLNYKFIIDNYSHMHFNLLYTASLKTNNYSSLLNKHVLNKNIL